MPRATAKILHGTFEPVTRTQRSIDELPQPTCKEEERKVIPGYFFPHNKVDEFCMWMMFAFSTLFGAFFLAAPFILEKEWWSWFTSGH